MPTCCSPFELTADGHFNQMKVAEELQRYRDKGPGPTTRLLVEAIARSVTLGGTVLDIGSGLGMLALALLERGATKAVEVDASSSYIAAAREEAERRNRADAIHFVHADFVHVAPDLPLADVVTLDRVVCCYPSCGELVQAALEHAEHCIALSYPRDRWYVRVGMRIENARRWFAANPFRTYVHPVAAIDGPIRRAGFRLSSRRETWMWSMDVYVRH